LSFGSCTIAGDAGFDVDVVEVGCCVVEVDVEVVAVADGCGDEEVGFPVCDALLMKLPESLCISITTRVIMPRCCLSLMFVFFFLTRFFVTRGLGYHKREKKKRKTMQTNQTTTRLL